MIHPDEIHAKAVNAFNVAERMRCTSCPLSPADLDLPVGRVVYQYIGEETDYGTPIAMPVALIYEIWKSGGTVQ